MKNLNPSGALIRSTALILPTFLECRAVRRQLGSSWVGRFHRVAVWRWKELWILQPGMGPCAVQRSIEAMQELSIQDVWLAGWCGGLNPNLQCGDIILPDCIVTPQGDRLPLELSPRIAAIVKEVARTSCVTVHFGPVLSSEKVVHDSQEKRSLEQAIAVEMEALPLHNWACQTDKGFFHVRVVLDPMHSSLPEASFWKVLLFWKQVKSIIRSFWHARTANRVLKGVVEAILRDHLTGALADLKLGSRELAGEIQ